MRPKHSAHKSAAGRYRLWNYLPILLLAAGMLFFCAIGLHALHTDLTEQISFCITHDGQTDTISLWEAEGDDEESSYYLFLPSYAALSDVTIETGSRKSVSIGEQTFRSGQSLSGLTVQESYSIRYGTTTGSFSILQSADTAALFIDTESDSLEAVNADKANTAKVNVDVYSVEGTAIYHSDNEYHGEFRGRGNSTWFCEKKPYRLNLADSIDLFGMGASQKWVLLANAYDETQMRNKLVYDFADQLGTLWTPASVYVDLYVDGQYQGLYQLTEPVEVSESRLNIPEDDILFLANYESHWNVDSIGFYTEGGKSIQLEDSFAPTEEKAALLKEELNALEQAIAAQEASLEEMIDFDSWADIYLLHEVFLNGELELNSSYFYWDIAGDGRIHAAAVWDFDLSLGNDNTVWTTAYSDPTKLLDSDELYSWFPGLLEYDSFREKVIARYEDTVRPFLSQFIETDIPQLEDMIRSARAMDDIRWQGKLDKTSADSAAATERMREFIEQRIRFLDDYWLSGSASESAWMENATMEEAAVESAASEAECLDSDQGTESAYTQQDTQGATGNRYLQLVRIALRKYGIILGGLGLFGLTGTLLVLIDWQRGRKSRR